MLNKAHITKKTRVVCRFLKVNLIHVYDKENVFLSLSSIFQFWMATLVRFARIYNNVSDHPLYIDIGRIAEHDCLNPLFIILIKPITLLQILKCKLGINILLYF